MVFSFKLLCNRRGTFDEHGNTIQPQEGREFWERVKAAWAVLCGRAIAVRFDKEDAHGLMTVEQQAVTAEIDRLRKTPGRPSGVGCPECGKELSYWICSSQTPEEQRRKVFCKGCGHKMTLA